MLLVLNHRVLVSFGIKTPPELPADDFLNISRTCFTTKFYHVIELI